MTRIVPLLLIGGLLATGCRSRPGAAAVAETTACAAANGVGQLRLVLSMQPAASETTEALVRLESETERSTIRVNATLGTTFELRPGRYRLSISLAGYNSAERQASVECGSNQTLTVPLTKKR